MNTFHIAYRSHNGKHMYVLGTAGLSRKDADRLLNDRLRHDEAFPEEYVASDSVLSAEDRRIAGQKKKIESWRLAGRALDQITEKERNDRLIIHGIPLDSNKALCGKRPSRGNSGWIEAEVDGKYDKSAPITCPDCLKLLSDP